MIYHNGMCVEIKYHFWKTKNGRSTHMVGVQIFALPSGYEAPMTELAATGGAEEIEQAVKDSFAAADEDLDIDWEAVYADWEDDEQDARA